jgi:hypothetical protein
VQTQLVERRCQGCGRAFRLRRQVGESGYNGVGGLRLCDACLAARVEAVVAARDQPRTCPQGHLLEGDNVAVYTYKGGYTQVHCKTCRRARDGARRARRKAAREGGAA